MHALTTENEALAREVVGLALARRREIPPPSAPPPAETLGPPLRAAITAVGLGGRAALDAFATWVAPASLPVDHPDFLAFIPQAPSEAAIYADWLVSATPTFAGAWHDGTGFIAAENAVLDWLASCAGLPAGAGGCFVPGATLARSRRSTPRATSRRPTPRRRDGRGRDAGRSSRRRRRTRRSAWPPG